VTAWHRWLHQRVTGARRVVVLARELSSLLEAQASVLDVGCGSGEVAFNLSQARPDLEIQGIDTYVRPSPKIPVTAYDGRTIPFPDKSFDFVMLIDVLHHTRDPESVLREARRVARRGIILKDHNANNLYTRLLLRFTDWFGNRAYGVKLEYNFLSRTRWREIFRRLQLVEVAYRDRFGLYPFWTRILFPADLDFFSSLALAGVENGQGPGQLG
jgi:SAM-dependent methyltransferase